MTSKNLTTPPRKKLSEKVPLFALISLIAGGIFLSLVQFFIHHLPQPVPEIPQADGIVVTTGGQARFSAGLTLLASGTSETMLLSGVGTGISKSIIADSFDLDREERARLACCVELEFVARNTKGNALAARRWAEENNASSLILVTAHYHMPRAMLEFKAALPDMDIYPYPIIPPDLERAFWLTNLDSLRLYAREYLKYQIRRLTLMAGF